MDNTRDTLEQVAYLANVTRALATSRLRPAEIQQSTKQNDQPEAQQAVGQDDLLEAQQSTKQNNSPITVVNDDVWHTSEGVVATLSEPTGVPTSTPPYEPQIDVQTTAPPKPTSRGAKLASHLLQ